MKLLAAIFGVILSGPIVYATDEFKVTVKYDGKVFPSYILATRTVDFDRGAKPPDDYLGDNHGPIGILYIPETDNSKVRVEISGGELIKSGLFEETIPTGGKRYRIYPKVVWDYHKLNHLLEPTSEDLTITLTVNDKPIGTRIQTIGFRSVYDCPLAFIEPHGQPKDYRWMFAAYVNENDPLIDTILHEALGHRLVREFKGYQGKPLEVRQEIFAVWNALQWHGVKYSNITTTSDIDPRIPSQHVRKLEDSVSNSEANCVDGSVLFASIFRKLGLHTELVTIPHHCFVRVSLVDKKPMQWLVLETTIIGSVNLANRPQDFYLSLGSFIRAINYGEKEFNKDRANFVPEKKLQGFELINIEALRLRGVAPLNSNAE